METDIDVDAMPFDPAVQPDRTGWTALDRRLHRWSLRDALRSASGPVPPAGWSLRRLAYTGAAALVSAASIGALAGGVWLGTYRFPGVALVPAALLIALGILILPRPAPLPADTIRLTPAAAPALHTLVERIAAAAGVAPPKVIAVNDRYTVEAGRHGLLRRTHLIVGAPLFMVADPAQRVALIARQLARFGSGEPALDPLFGSVDRSLKATVQLLEPREDQTIRAVQDAKIMEALAGLPPRAIASSQGAVWLAELILRPFVAVLRAAASAVRLSVVATAQRDAHLAAYRADAAAARIAGTSALTGAFGLILLAEPIITTVRSTIRSKIRSTGRRDDDTTVVTELPALAARTLRNCAATLPRLEEENIHRTVSPYATRPPLGLAARTLAGRPEQPATLDLTAADSAEIDRELSPAYTRLVRDLRNS